MSEINKIRVNNVDYDIGGSGGGNEIYIGDEQDAPASTKLLIDSDDIDFNGSEVVNSLSGNETNKAPSVSAVNNALNNIETLDIYSTTEQRIGTWVDNRPIYQKTLIIDGSSLSTGNNLINHNISNLDTIIRENVITKRSDGRQEYLPLVPAWADGIQEWGIYNHDIDSTTLVIAIGTQYTGLNGTPRITDLYIILEYTKTTDTVGGGN